MNVGIDGLYFARRGAARPDVVKQIMALAFMSRAISTAEDAIASAESIGTGVFARIKLYLQLENVVISYICVRAYASAQHSILNTQHAQVS
jgi:hypothetical protein